MLTKENTPRKKQIEEIATVLFKERGYGASSMRDLASAVGIEAASIYSHIKSKEEILQNICFRLANQFLTSLEEVENQGLRPEEKLRHAMIAHIGIITADLSASAVFWNEWKHMSDPYRGDFLLMKNDYERRFVSIIEDGIQNGVFTAGDSKITSQLLLSSLNGIHHWYKPTSSRANEDFASQITETLLSGVLNTETKY